MDEQIYYTHALSSKNVVKRR